VSHLRLGIFISHLAIRRDPVSSGRHAHVLTLADILGFASAFARFDGYKAGLPGKVKPGNDDYASHL